MASLWLHVADNAGDVCGVGMSTPPHGLLISEMPPEASDAVARFMIANRPDIPAIDGPIEVGRVIAGLVAASSGRTVKAGLSQRLLTTDAITRPSAIPGRMRGTTADDADTVIGWMVAFNTEAMPDHPANPALPAMLRRRLGSQPTTIWLWEVDGASTSLCWQSVAAAGVVRISAVYTPPEHRGHGYASANVAALSEKALADGAELVMLYTDSANPTSNKIYEAIGYRHVGDAMEWFLD